MSEQAARKREAPKEVRPHQPGQAAFRAIFSEDIEWRPFAAFPPEAVILIWTQPKSGRCHSRASLFYEVEHSNGGLITFGGGIPLKDTDGTVIGAVGVSGSSVDNDVRVAKAALEACNSRKSATA